MTFDKVLRYTGIVLGLSSGILINYSVVVTFILFFVGLILIKFGTQIKFEREKFLFMHGEKHE